MNDEERRVVALYKEASRSATVENMKDALPFVLLPEIAAILEKAIAAVSAMSDEEFADLELPEPEPAENEEV